MKNIIAYDLGTGGVKASLYNENADTIAKVFVEYDTFYPGVDLHEQKPATWWDAVVKSTNLMLSESQVSGSEIACISLSGHSLVAVPVDNSGQALLEQVPIWSDTRARDEVSEFFSKVSETDWYMTTGNGFPPPCYSIFKLMWMKKHRPEVFSKIYKVLGSKDYINLKLTGKFYTDYSYISGSGAYDLTDACVNDNFLKAADLSSDIFPEIVESSRIIGTLTPDAAKALGLSETVSVACGGVDNSCMALGAVGAGEGGCYLSLGSSSWIAVNSSKPVLHPTQKPYVFAHIEPGMFTSAFSIFSGGSSLKWACRQIFKDLPEENLYEEINRLAAAVPIGSGGVLFNPSLAGGTSQDKSPHIRGAFLNLSLGTTRDEMIRATMEGITLNLKMSLLNLKDHVTVSDEMLFCGGGSKSPFWMQMFADVFDMTTLKTNIDQDAASFGAAAIAFVAMGIWKDYSLVPGKHKIEKKTTPIADNVSQYNEIFPRFVHINTMMSELGDYIYKTGELKNKENKGEQS